MTFGDRLRALRKQAGLSQEELGEQAGVSRTLIGHYETDFRKPSRRTLTAITKALDIDVSALTAESDEDFLTLASSGGYKAKYETIVGLLDILGKNNPETKLVHACERLQQNIIVMKSLLVACENSQTDELERLRTVKAMTQNICDSFDNVCGALPRPTATEKTLTDLFRENWEPLGPMLQNFLRLDSDKQKLCMDVINKFVESQERSD